jgi:hypothetical protein
VIGCEDNIVKMPKQPTGSTQFMSKSNGNFPVIENATLKFI